MALQLQLQALTVPDGTEFPGTVQDLLELIAQYEEIAGGENFNGVNYGSVEPDPADRDKAWLRTDGSGEFLGWYVWTGAAWTILPAKSFVGTIEERDALADPQGGYLWHVVGTGLSTFVESENAWEWGFPAANEDLAGDKNYYFSSHQLLVDLTGEEPTWEEADLAALIATSGIPAANIVAAIIRLDVQNQVGFGGPGTFTATIRAASNDLISTSASDTLQAVAFCVRDQSAAGANNTVIGPLPMTGGQESIYYNLTITPGIAVAGKVWLVGFVYQPF